ncbi:glycerophosphodiester phosphodiesterase family protein [Bailinhaonella thermotolerans]|uniref:Glycerophosphodiester phosphodiesterase n=1 Tax=Bailinhaonella thermotolerans TaxID=1070861 RepID=A0A3A4BLU6_9ACTN|nr:glycerophosphodiester phosphodiesterase family protein [Bailinhaonella thermotolerans]RJL31992.1 glycerophosphodiester phosphodiesterase [Bailinhaonella thermotolerans]
MRVELHGHRGARGLRPENTLPGLVHALELGVDALEIDVAMTADRSVVLTHDLTVSSATSQDTGPAFRGDPKFPYVGRPVAELSLAQLRTLECGVRLKPDPFVATHLDMPGTRMPTLGAALGLLAALEADGVRINVELKSDPSVPWLSPDPFEFTELVVAELERHGRRGPDAAILSFDWRVLSAARSLAPAMQRYALIEEQGLEPGTPWLGGLHLDDFDGDVAAAAAEIGATTLSPEHVLVTSELMARAHAQRLPVVAWTVNEPDEAERLISLGVAGIVTDYPNRMRHVLESRGLPAPQPIRR